MNVLRYTVWKNTAIIYHCKQKLMLPLTGLVFCTQCELGDTVRISNLMEG